MPHLVDASFAALYRGFFKANLIHHLAHTGDAATLRKIGEAWAPGLIPDLEPSREAERVFSIPTGKLKPADLAALEKLTGVDAKIALGLNYLRLWTPETDWFAKAEQAFDAAVAAEDLRSGAEMSAWLRILRAEARRSRLDYKGAMADFDEALKLEPENALALAFKARVLFQTGTRREDLKVIDRAIELAPREGWIVAWRGESLRRLGELKGAERDLRKALVLDPLYDQAYGWLARVLEAQGRHAEALPLLEKGIALCPDFEKAYRPLVRALRGAGRLAEALEALDRAASLNHRNGWLGVWRVEGQADESGALPPLQEYVDGHPDDGRARRWLGEALTQLGRHEDALTQLDRALGLEPASAWARAWKGEALLKLGRAAEARVELDAALGLDPEYGRAWAWRGRLKADAGDWKGALADYEQALGRRRIEYAWLFAWRGEAQLELGRASAALRDLDAAVALDAGRPEFRRLRARARHILKDVGGACEDLLCSTGDASFPWPVVAESERMRRAGDLAGALEKLEALPRESFVLLLRYRLKAALGVKAAHRDVDAAFRMDPKAGWVFGVEPLPEGAPEAWAFLQDASFADDPACAPVWAYQGQARLQRGDRGGLSFLERAAELAPESGWILAWLGEAMRQAGKPELARLALDRALECDPRYANAWGWRATLMLADDPKAAERDLTKALTLQKTARFYKDRSLARRALRDWKGACADMEQAVRLNPDLSWEKPSEEALQDLSRERFPGADGWRAEMLLRLGRPAGAKKLLKNAKTALELVWRAESDLESAQAGKDLAKALKLDPKLAQAWAAKAKRDGDAKAALRAVKCAPYSASLRLLAARTIGSGAKARAEAEQALALAPGYAEAERFLQSLDDPASPYLEYFTNYSCNAKCPFCFNPPDASPELEKGLPFATLSKKLYEGYRDGFRGVKFIGGEATMRDDLPKLVGLAKKLGYRGIQLTTNGIRLADPAYARRLTALGVDRYRFSIHGHTPELHDRLVGVPGALEKLEKAVENLRPLGVRFGINYVLNAVNYKKLPETLLYFYEKLKIDDVIVYFLRYQGFAELPKNEELLALRFKQAAPVVEAAFEALKAKGFTRMPALIHFAPCVAPSLQEHMLDWRRAPEDADRVTLPDGSGGRIEDVTNDGKRPVAACANCRLRRVCFGIEERYVDRYGDREFKPL